MARLSPFRASERDTDENRKARVYGGRGLPSVER